MSEQADTEAIEQALQRWAARREQVAAERSKLVLAALAGGVNKHRIHTLSGIARTTIDDILGKADDPGMREALVRSLAQYILRGELRTKQPPHTDAQVLARVRREVAEMTAYDYTFPEGEAERIAADAEELARWQQDRNVNWQDWAYGH